MNEYQKEAKRLVIQMQFQKHPIMFEAAKNCALVCVEELLSILRTRKGDYMFLKKYEFYKKVKEEIQNS